MPTGTVKWLNTTKDYTTVQSGEDVFEHISAVEGAGLCRLTDTQSGAFELFHGQNGQDSQTTRNPSCHLAVTRDASGSAPRNLK